MKKEKRKISRDTQKLIIAMIVCIFVFVITLVIAINNWIPSFGGNRVIQATYLSIVILLLMASGMGTIVTVEVFVVGLIMRTIYNRRFKKSIVSVRNVLSYEYASVKILDKSDLRYFLEDDDIKCEAKLGEDGTVDLKIQIDVKVELDTLTFTDNFDIL